tara:strand:- start:43 stop:1275 length:1233 start_codon:yes stop_codon:yes gene_type:complete
MSTQPEFVGPAQRKNTWILNEWYDQAVAGTQGDPVPPIELWAWGFNEYGTLGQNNVIPYSSPVQIPGTWDASTFKSEAPGNRGGQLNAGQECGSMTKRDGTLWYIGGVDFDMGTSGLNNTTEYSSPTQVGTDTTWTRPVGTLVTLSRKTDGTLWSWGRNDYGQAGHNNRTNYSSPIQIGTDTTWNYVNAFGLVSMATKTDGSLWFWGDNEFGSWGTNQSNDIRRSSPVQMGNTGDWSNHNGFATSESILTAGIKSDNSLWTWGKNEYGQLGVSDKTQRSSPVQIPGTWKSFTWARNYAGLGIKTNGTLWSWGVNQNGRLGQNQPEATEYSSPKQIGTNTDWVRVGNTGRNSFGAVNDSKELYVWGKNDYGQLGINDRTTRSSPTQVPGTWYGVSTSYTGFGAAVLAAKVP